VGFTKFKIPHKLRVLNLHLPSTLKTPHKWQFFKGKFQPKRPILGLPDWCGGQKFNALIS